MDAKIHPKNYWGIRMEYKSFMEALKGKQHKIDKNKNGKVDAHDFELLRKEETQELDEALDPSEIAGNPKMYDAATVKKAYYHNKTTPEDKKTLERHLDRHHGMRDWRNSVKEETEELDEIRRMKTKLNTLDDISNKSVARQKLSNLMKSGKARGALIANKMRTLNMGDDLDQEDLDALYEVLSKDAKAGDYISDFVYSTNPKFDGKSKKERINMALGAYYSTHKKKDGISEGNGYDDNRRGFGKPPREDDEYHVPDPTVKKTKLKKEEVEEIEEGGQIYGKPPQPVKIDTTLKFKPTGEKTSGDNPLKKPFTVPSQRSNAPAGAKSVKESVLDKVRSRVSGELEQSSKHRQALSAARNQAAIDREHNHSATHAAGAEHDQEYWRQQTRYRDDNHDDRRERNKIQQAHDNKQRDKINSAFTKKVTKEEVDVNEWIETQHEFHLRQAAYHEKQGKPERAKYHKDRAAEEKSSHDASMRADAELTRKYRNEETEQIEERNKQNAMMRKTMDASRGARYKLNNPVPAAEPEHKTARDHNVAIGRALRSEDKMTTTKDKSGKLISFKYEGDWKKSTEKKQGSGKAANLAGQAMQKMAKANEQAPVAPVPDKKYIKGTPENKAYKATKKPINGMPTNKMSEEKDEQEYGYEGDMALNQLATLTRCAEMIKEILKPDTDMPEWVQSKITLATDYIQTAADYMHSEMNEAKSVEVKVNAAGDAAHEEKWEAVKKVKKPVKESFDDEGNLISNKVSYKEFMLEYTPGPGGVTRIKGRSYGANYSDPEGADDADDNKPMKPAAEKRGRGRPAGAKSGARKITGTSKLMNK
jgi:hypothetical protein